MNSSRYVGRHGGARHAHDRRSPAPQSAFAGRAVSATVAGVGFVVGCGALVAALGSAAIGSDGSDGSGERQNSRASGVQVGRNTIVTSRSGGWSAPDAVVALPGTKAGGHGSAGVLGVEAEPKSAGDD